MEHMCDCCGKERDVYAKSVKHKNGARVVVYLCDDCLQQIENAEVYYVKTSKGYVKNEPVAYGDVNYSKSGWTSFVKVLNVILFIALIIVGMIVGASIGDAVSYEDAAVALGMFVGMILGALVGAVIVSFSMLFVEISENLAGILEIIKKDR